MGIGSATTLAFYTTPSEAQVPVVCTSGTPVSEFFKTAREKAGVTKVYVLKSEAFAKIVINKLKADAFYFAFLPDGRVGTMLSYKGCVVVGSVGVVAMDQFVSFMDRHGITPSDATILGDA